ncbi:hypothetical protein AcV5_003245 [Taiwanofungus camphoratus]|nr:hypothetical protein AcV5_003245 [Antrodia cinnamomea]
MNPPALMRTVWSVMAHVVVSGVSDILVRGFFCLRVWKLSGKNWVLAGLIVSTSLVAFAGNLAFTIRGLMIGNFLKFTEISWIVYMNLACCISADMLIAISLCTSLMRRRTGFTKTDSLLRTLMVYTINTGALTGICTILCLIFYATMPPNNFTYVAFYFVLPPLLVNAFLATLNARQALRENTMGGVISIQASPRGAVEISTRSEVIRTYSTSDTFGMRPTSMGDSSQGELNEWKSKFSRLRDSVVEEV